ncbi:hypothetical protein SAMN04488541_101112 [Thermoflexibacter ruber]|uniref:Uncharacterized protein n=1 Tax=Thermoflexibacter ruber TaxID=1003 RepID=A0A1I2ET65_9BACT|nr:hypothetical protein SAMN04488541_101112 [Thermoflexibacter ruber]
MKNKNELLLDSFSFIVFLLIFVINTKMLL